MVARERQGAHRSLVGWEAATAAGKAILILGVSFACSRAADRPETPPAAGGTPPVNATANGGATKCDAANGGLTLPPGFCATVFADALGGTRHPVAAPNGDVFIALQTQRTKTPSGGIVVLRDVNRDGVADTTQYFGPFGGGGIALEGTSLYVDAKTAIVRYTIPVGAMMPSAGPDTIVSGIPSDGNHTSRDLMLDGKGNLYVNVGSATNSCQEKDRSPGSRGIDPCVELETRAGIWKFSDSQKGQNFSSAERFATGIRNAVGLAWNAHTNLLYATQHGRDQLSGNWPALYTEQKSANNPAEELLQVNAGDDFGWPYCYYDIDLKHLVLAPEYGGDAKSVGRCSSKKAPIVAFPGHWAPNALAFYTGSTFPAKYRDGAFIAFHGSWNRNGEPQAGYRVVFAPAKDWAFDGTYETFADNFAGSGAADPSKGLYRPTGLISTPDGALVITDDKTGRVWKVWYTGGK
jgi:glucose/arabinose dehydrogenase